MDQEDKLVSLYADVPASLKYKLDKITLERSRGGGRVTLRTVVMEALEGFVAVQSPDDAPEPPAAYTLIGKTSGGATCTINVGPGYSDTPGLASGTQGIETKACRLAGEIAAEGGRGAYQRAALMLEAAGFRVQRPG